MRAGSIYVTRPTLADYVDDMGAAADKVFAMIKAGELRTNIGAVYPLADAAEAHKALEGRQTVGKVLLDTRSSK